MWPLNVGKQPASVQRRGQNKWLKDMCQPLNPRTVLNLGARPNDPDKEGGKYSDYFPNADFKALDRGECSSTNYIQADLMDSIDHIGTFDLVLCMSVIEHIDKPWVAAVNISTLVEPGGYLFVAMPWFYPTHEGPGFGDHWRARPSGLKILFDDLEVVREEYCESSILLVRDRGNYWRDQHSNASGSAVLFQKPT